MEIDIDGFSGRLNELIGNESKSEFARSCGMPESSLRNYLNGRLPGIDVAAKISDARAVNLEWLISGRGPKNSSSKTGGVVFTPLASKGAGDGRVESIDDDEEIFFKNNELISIPAYLEVRPSAGHGAVATSDRPTSFMAFNRRWLRDIGVNPIFASILIAEGDSMFPTIPNGSPMLVDTSQTEIRHGCIYAFDLDGDLMVKRIERLPDGTIDLISDNKERYPTRNISRDRLAQMNVVGRVFSAVRTF